MTAIYPKHWPRCPGCDRASLDGHITCGRFLCDEYSRRRELDDRDLADALGLRHLVREKDPQ